MDLLRRNRHVLLLLTLARGRRSKTGLFRRSRHVLLLLTLARGQGEQNEPIALLDHCLGSGGTQRADFAEIGTFCSS